MIKIYLAGAMEAYAGTDKASKWRDEFVSELQHVNSLNRHEFTCINPLDYYTYENNDSKSELEIFKFDLRKVRQSDILLVNLSDIRSSIGTCIECYEAYKDGIPVLGFLEQEIQSDDELKQIIHPWVYSCFDRIETGKYAMDEIILYLTRAYLL